MRRCRCDPERRRGERGAASARQLHLPAIVERAKPCDSACRTATPPIGYLASASPLKSAGRGRRRLNPGGLVNFVTVSTGVGNRRRRPRSLALFCLDRPKNCVGRNARTAAKWTTSLIRARIPCATGPGASVNALHSGCACATAGHKSRIHGTRERRIRLLPDNDARSPDPAGEPRPGSALQTRPTSHDGCISLATHVGSTHVLCVWPAT